MAYFILRRNRRIEKEKGLLRANFLISPTADDLLPGPSSNMDVRFLC